MPEVAEPAYRRKPEFFEHRMASIPPRPATPSMAAPERLFILGIDPSLSRTGYCVMVDGMVEAEGVLPTTPDQPRPARLIQVREAVRKLFHFASMGRVLVAMEAEVWMASAAQGSEQAAIQGVLQTMLWEHLRAGALPPIGPWGRFLSVNVSHVKKYAGAKQKDEILLQVYKRWGREFHDHNIADAFIIATIGNDFYNYHVHGRLWPEASRAQIEVLDKLVERGLVWEGSPARKARKKKRAL